MNRLSVFAVALCFTLSVDASTGRQIQVITQGVPEIVDINGAPYGSLPLANIAWDRRCANVAYTFNGNVGANPGTATEISPEALVETIQRGLDRWNANPASYIEMHVTSIKDLGSRPRVAGDFINEVTFITPDGFTALASSPSTSLQADTTFIAGDDLDGDGDSDVFDPAVAGINECTDIDNDGDIEFPAGFYKAGTILDNDVQFASGIPWELEATGGDSIADVDAVSVHEFGHSHGLSHSLINQISDQDGTGSTMFPFAPVSDAESEISMRTPHIDDFAASAFIYPEGSAATGIAALQPGDIDFDDAYDVLEGEILTDGAPIVGANVTAFSSDGNVALSSAFSGSSVVFADIFDVNGDGRTELFATPDSVVSGKYKLPVPAGGTYTVKIEAVDDNPVSASSINTNVIIGSILGQNTFPEEGFNQAIEGEFELRPSALVPFYSGGQQAKQLNFQTNQEIVQANFEDLDLPAVLDAILSSSVIHAEVFDRAEMRALIAEGAVPIRGTFRTGSFDSSYVSVFNRAQLALAKDIDGILNVTQVLRTQENFVAQEGDFSSFDFHNPEGLPYEITGAFNSDPDLRVVLLLEANSLPVGPSGFSTAFLAIDEDVSGTSYVSLDGSPIFQLPFTWLTELRYVDDENPVNPYLVSSAALDE